MTTTTETRPIPAEFWVSPAMAKAAQAATGRTTAALAVREPVSAPVPSVPELGPGELVLGYGEALLREYARFPSQAARDAAVLWAAHTWMRNSRNEFTADATGRLTFLSSEPESGKSRALRLVGMLSAEFHGLDSEPSEAGLIWTLSKEHATVFLDEADILFGKGKRKAAVRSILNAGYEQGGTHLRMRGMEGSRVDCFGPVAIAGLDVMEKDTGSSLDALFTRCIRIRMHQSQEAVPPLDAAADDVAALLRTHMSQWISVLQQDGLPKPVIPAGVKNRQAQIWTPLLAIAEAAGGPWPERARAVASEAARVGYLDGDPATAEERARPLADRLADLTTSWGRR